MKHRLSWWIWAAIALFAAVLISGIGVMLWGPRLRGWRLPDGTRMTLEAVTYGKSHVFAQANWWQRLFSPFLSAEMKSQLRTLSYTSRAPNSLVFWSERQAAGPSQPLRPPFGEIRAVSFDERGNIGETGAQILHEWRLRPPEREQDGWILLAFPRRGRTVGLRLLGRNGAGGWQRFAEFTVPNPTPGPHPIWAAPPLPNTQPAGDLRVTLVKLSTGAGLDDAGRPAAPDQDAWTHAIVRAKQDGHPAATWQPSGLTLSDATGNVWTPSLRTRRISQGEEMLSFRGALWPGEPAWKLRISFTRTAGFDPGELWTVRGLPVPGTQRTVRLGQFTTRQGVRLSLQSISGRAAGPCLTANPCVEVRTSPGLEDLKLILFRARDDRGQEITPSPGIQRSQDRFSFDLMGAAASQSVDLTFAIQKARVVEFLAAPVRL